MKIFDCMVIGMGVVGASIFNKLTRIGKSVVAIDKASDVATGASKANSGVVHAGFDPLPGSLKAKLNVRGSQLFPSICERLGVKLNSCGALVVGSDRAKIEALFKRGVANGVPVEVWEREKILQVVPDIADDVTVALFAPTSKVVSPYLLTIALTDEGILNGGEVFLEEDLVKIAKKTDYFEIKTQKNTFFARKIVNSAGAGFNDVAKILGDEQKQIEFRRGEYFIFDKACKLNVPLTVFPLPNADGKGVLVSPTVDGNFLVGPTSEPSDLCTKTTASGLQAIKQKSAMTVKNLNFKHAIREFAGVRVICGDDFVIEKSKKVDGVVNLAGICSPGMSSAPAIAEMVVQLLGYDCTEKSGLKKIEPYVLFKDMPKSVQRKLIKENPYHKEIVCKCEHITKGDVMFALNRPLKVKSVDGVKRRTTAGMGRCQGGFCFTKVVGAIMQARGLEYEQVLKENRGSEIAIGNMREVKK